MLLIIWDFDGTLANSEKKFKSIVDNFLREKIINLVTNGDKFTEEFYYKNCAGKKYTDTFKVMGEHGIIDYSKIDGEILDDFLDFANESFKTVLPSEISITKGMDVLLEKLSKNENIAMLIATSAIKHDFMLKCKAVNNPVVNAMDGYSCHELADDYEYLNLDKYEVKNKPNPAIFLYALEKELEKGGDIDRVLVIEDSSSGCKAGRNFADEECLGKILPKANVKVIGYTAGDHRPNPNTLLDSGADVIIENAEDLFDFIEKFQQS